MSKAITVRIEEKATTDKVPTTEELRATEHALAEALRPLFTAAAAVRDATGGAVAIERDEPLLTASEAWIYHQWAWLMRSELEEGMRLVDEIASRLPVLAPSFEDAPEDDAA